MSKFSKFLPHKPPGSPKAPRGVFYKGQEDREGWGRQISCSAPLSPACLALGEHKVRPDPPGPSGSPRSLRRAEQWSFHPGPDRFGGAGVGLRCGSCFLGRGEPRGRMELPVGRFVAVSQHGKVLPPPPACIFFFPLRPSSKIWAATSLNINAGSSIFIYLSLIYSKRRWERHGDREMDLFMGISNSCCLSGCRG